MRKYDIIVIGSGGGAKIVSPAASLGYKVAVLEKEDLGGTCLNRGCIPSKMLIYPAELVSLMQRAAKFELGFDYRVNADFEKLISRISNTVDAESKSIAPKYDANPNIDYIPHEGRFISDKVIEVAGEQITADKIFIAVGSRPHIPDIPGLAGTPFMTSREALRNTHLPKKLIVIGAGYIACELGYAYGALGSEVDFVVRSVMLRNEDLDIQKEFQREFEKEHRVHLGFLPTKVSYTNGEFQVECKNNDGRSQVLTADALLVATGIVPNSDLLGLEKTGIKRDEAGFVQVDEFLQTSVPGVFALGDVIGRYLFRHSVNFEGEYLMRTLFIDQVTEAIDYPPMPHAVFTHPQIAGVGKTEQELRQEGVDYAVGISSYKDSAMGMARLSDHGFVKVIADRRTRHVLGVHIIGDEASDLVHTFIAVMTMNGTVDDLLKMIYIHPSLSEVARNAVRKARIALSKKSN